MGNLTLEDVNNMYLDVLKEIGNIGAGNATTAIANMLGMKIDMNVPNVKLMEVSKLGTAVGAEDETIVGIFLEVMNDIEGSMMFLVDIPSARYLVNKLMMEDVPADKPFDEMELFINLCPLLFDEAYDPKYGARPLRRQIQNDIEDELAEEILSGKVKKDTEVVVTIHKEKVVFETK